MTDKVFLEYWLLLDNCSGHNIGIYNGIHYQRSMKQLDECNSEAPAKPMTNIGFHDDEKKLIFIDFLMISSSNKFNITIIIDNISDVTG